MAATATPTNQSAPDPMPSTTDEEASSFTSSDVGGCDGYLVLTFTKPKRAEVKQAAFADLR